MKQPRDRLNILRDQAGETLVELMVSIVIFLLLLGTLAGAISFATAAQQKAQSLRDNAAAFQQSVRHGAAAGETAKTEDFYATTYNESETSPNAACQIPLKLQTISATGADGTSTTDFAVFGTDKTPAQGGGGSGG